MRTREAGYAIADDKVQEVFARIQNGGIEARQSLIEIAYRVYAEKVIADDLYLSIIYGYSYDYIEAHLHTIPLERRTWYGYRRKIISIWAIAHGYEAI